jgi:RNA polymerase sigma-70 factor (ECF subfamily)
MDAKGVFMTDAELVRRARTGETRALAELMTRWAPRALALCHVHANRQAAADLAQDSLLRAIRNLPQLKTPDYFGAWLRGIVKRVCYDWMDNKRRTMIPFSAMSKAEFDVRELIQEQTDEEDRQEASDELNEALSQLPDECREVVHLYYSSKFTYQELAEMLEVSAATINARLTRARTMLRERLIPRVETRT